MDGTSYIYLQPDQQPRRRQGVELHELVHADLLDNTAYGRFQQMLDTAVALAPAGSFRDRCRELLDFSMTACAVTHEGLAAYRELCWVAANEDPDSARRYLDQLPSDYRQGVDLVSSLLGSPFSDPYQGLNAPAFHTLLIALGSALMNTPILAEYADPERIFREPLSWVLVDGPDQRLEEFHARAGVLGDTLRSLAGEPLRATMGAWEATRETALLVRFWDLAVEALRQAAPDVPMLTNTECGVQASPFSESWVQHLNRVAGREVIVRGPQVEDVGGSRSLNMRVYPASYDGDETRSVQENAIRVEGEFLVGLSEGRQRDDIFRLGIMGTLDRDPPMEGFLELLSLSRLIDAWEQHGDQAMRWRMGVGHRVA